MKSSNQDDDRQLTRKESDEISRIVERAYREAMNYGKKTLAREQKYKASYIAS